MLLSFGSNNFNTSLEELKDYLNFNLTTFDTNSEQNLSKNMMFYFVIKIF